MRVERWIWSVVLFGLVCLQVRMNRRLVWAYESDGDEKKKTRKKSLVFGGMEGNRGCGVRLGLGR